MNSSNMNDSKITEPTPAVPFMTEERSSAVSSRRVTREMVYARTVELTLLAGRNALQIHQRDYERAKRELTGVSDFDRQQEVLDRYHG